MRPIKNRSYNNLMDQRAELFIKLLDIITRLRDPDSGCPWDIKQTHESLKEYIIEEAYELVEAIDSRSADAEPSEADSNSVPEELGDVLLQVVLHAQIGKDSGSFDISDVIRLISDKLIHRHPHVFGNVTVAGAEEVAVNWERLKRRDRKDAGPLDGIPAALPGLLKAHRLGERAARAGFDWNTPQGAWQSVVEELQELESALTPPAAAAEELGDLLFALSQLARKLGLNSEELLQDSCRKFSRRFGLLEKLSPSPLEELQPEEMQRLWERTKEPAADSD